MDREEDQLLTVSEVAAYLRVDPESARRWLRERKLHGVHLGRRSGWRIRRADLVQFLVERQGAGREMPANGDGDTGAVSSGVATRVPRSIAYVDDLAALGGYICGRRRVLGLSQTELGARINWPQGHISLLEAGKYGTPSLRVLALVAHALVVSRFDVLVAIGFLHPIADGPAPQHEVDG